MEILFLWVWVGIVMLYLKLDIIKDLLKEILESIKK